MRTLTLKHEDTEPFLLDRRYLVRLDNGLWKLFDTWPVRIGGENLRIRFSDSAELIEITELSSNEILNSFLLPE